MPDSENGCGLSACSSESLPGLPALLVPALPVGLKGAPFEEADCPGVTV